MIKSRNKKNKLKSYLTGIILFFSITLLLVLSSEKVEAAFSCDSGSLNAGQTCTVSSVKNLGSGDTLISGEGSLLITGTGSIVGYLGQATEISVANLEIQTGGSINFNGKGYAGGAGGTGNVNGSSGQGYADGEGLGGTYTSGSGGGGAHGGTGGTGENGATGIGGSGGTEYEEYTTPIQLGSGGGGGGGFYNLMFGTGTGGSGGIGGGAISLNISGTFNNAGTISANGGIGANGSYTSSVNYGGSGGGGAGGSILIEAGTITGAGSITATGGAGGTTPTVNKRGGGGAGGKIAIKYTTDNSSNFTKQAYGGSGYQIASAGSIYTKQGSADGNLSFYNGGSNSVQTRTISYDITVDNLTFSEGTGAFVINSGITLDISNTSSFNFLGTFTNNGTLTAESLADTLTFTGAFINNGTINTNTVPTIVFSSTFNNTTEYSPDLASAITFSSTFTNSGTFTPTSLTSATITGAFTNSGTITAPALTTLTFSSTSTNSGTITANSLTTLDVNGTSTNSGTFSATTLDDLNIDASMTINPGRYDFPSNLDITIEDNGILTHSANTTAKTYYIDLDIANLTIQSGGQINLNGKGYSGGAGGTGAASGSPGQGYADGEGLGGAQQGGSGGGGAHGGTGGTGENGATGIGGSGGTEYEEYTTPIQLGSGGGGGGGFYNLMFGTGTGGSGGIGGGAISLNISGTFNNAGTISANGGIGANGSYTSSVNYGGSGGGGAGGSILIEAGTITGAGSITATGGAGGTTPTVNKRGGGGAGGKIAIKYTTDNSSNFTKQAYGGSGYQIASAGSIYTKQGSADGNLSFYNGGSNSVQTRTISYDITVDNLTFSEGTGAFVINSGITLDISNTSSFNFLGTFTNNGTLTAESLADTLTFTGAFINNGTINTNTVPTIVFSSTFNNTTEYSPDLASAITFSSTFTNSGTFTPTSLTSATITGAFTNSGTITAPALTTLTFSSTSTNSGTITANSLTTLDVNGTSTNSGTFSATTLDDLNIDASMTINPGRYDFPSNLDITIEDNGILTHSANTTAKTYYIDLDIANLTIQSGGQINLNGKGYSGGAGGTGAASGSPGQGYADGEGLGGAQQGGSGGGGAHGGNGGTGAAGFAGTGGTGGIEYEEYTTPIQLGSGGGGGGGFYDSMFGTGTGGSGGIGGGAISLNISGTFNNAGTISANGGIGANGSYTSSVNYGGSGGGGAGGSILIEAGTITGAGSITATGGAGGTTPTVNRRGGGGSGGRIALRQTTTQALPSMTMTVTGGTGNVAGEAGSIYGAMQGTFFSEAIDLAVKREFTTLSYTKSTGANTEVSISARSGNTNTPDDGSWTAWQDAISSGGSISGLNDNRYIQYRVALLTTNLTETPILEDISIGYNNYGRDLVSNWGRRVAIETDPTKVDADLTDFPMLLAEVNFPQTENELFDADGTYPALSNGCDLRFTSDASGETELPFEIVSFSTNNNPALGTAEIWVKTNLSSTVATTIYAWYNNPSASCYEADDTYGSENVWDSNYKTVQHMKDATTSTISDSTLNANTGAKVSANNPIQATGKIGEAQTFDGNSDYINLGTSSSLNFTGYHTIDLWAKSSNTANPFISNNSSLGFWDAYLFSTGPIIYLGTNNYKWFAVQSQASDNGWHRWTFVTKGTSNSAIANAELYMDGNLISSSSVIEQSGPIEIAILNYIGKASAFYFGGQIDDIRISNIDRSSTWISTEYNNQNSPGDFADAGTPVLPVPSSITSSAYNTNSAANALIRLTWTEDISAEGTDIKFQARTAPDVAGSPGTWTEWLGPTGTDDYYTDPLGGEAVNSENSDGSGDQWMQYRAYFVSNGSYTPTLSEVNLLYVVNVAPELQSLSATQDTSVTTTDTTVELSFEVKDSDTTTAIYTQNFLTPSYEYSLDDGGTWQDVDTDYITYIVPVGGEATDTNSDGEMDLRVLEDSYLNYIAVWDAPGDIPDEYTTQAKLRLTVNDNEGAYNTAVSSSDSFELDTTIPVSATATAVVVDAKDYPDTGDAELSLLATDDTAIQMKVGLEADLSDATWEAYATTKTIALDEATSTVYAQFKDIKGNLTVIHSATPPDTGEFMMIQDTSNMKDPENPIYALFISWLEISEPTPGFKQYNIYRKHSTELTHTYLDSTVEGAIELNYYYDDTVTYDELYTYRINAEDIYGNTSAFTDISPTGKANGAQDAGEGGGGEETTQPEIYDVEIPSGEIYTNQATIYWDTNEISNSTVEYITETGGDFTDAPSQGVASIRDRETDDSGDENGIGLMGRHQVTLTNLTPNTTYYLQLKSTDPIGNTGSSKEGTDGYTFTTLDGPAITNVTVPNISNQTATITWKTIDTDSNSYVIYAESTADLDNELGATVGNTNQTQNHEVEISGLTQGTHYYFYVTSGIARDTNGGNYYDFTTPSDTTPPIITFDPETDITNITDTSARVSWTTNESATSTLEYGEDTTYDLGTLTNENYNSNHSFDLTGLTKGTTYYIRITSTDINTNDSVVAGDSFTTTDSEDYTAPEITFDPNTGITNITATTARITFTTNELAVSTLEYGEDTAYGEEESLVNYNISQIFNLENLTPNTTYYFKLSATDTNTNTTEDDNSGNGYTFTTSAEEDNDGPTISNVSVLGITYNSATVSWETDGEGNSLVDYGTTNSYGKTQGDSLASLTTHEIILDGLNSITTYYYQVKSMDAENNITTKSTDSETSNPDNGNLLTFTTLAPTEDTDQDGTGDQLTDIMTQIQEMISSYSFTEQEIQEALAGMNNLSITSSNPDVSVDGTTVTIKWTTNRSSVGEISYWQSNDNEDTASTFKEETTEARTSHEIILKSLNSNTKYNFYVKSIGLLSAIATSNTQTFQTEETPQVSGLSIENVTLNSADISWSTTDSVNSSVLEYGEDTSYGNEEEGETSNSLHTVSLTNLKTNTTYHLRVSGEDSDGQTITSNDYSFTTVSLPTISDVKVKDITTETAVITWTTNVKTDSRVEFKRENQDQGTTQGNLEAVTDHSFTLTNLYPGSKYTFKVSSKDALNNESSSEENSFTTEEDLNPPQITNVKSDTTVFPGKEAQIQTIISWNTDKNATSVLAYREGVQKDPTLDEQLKNKDVQKIENWKLTKKNELTKNHLFVLTDLKPASLYQFKVVSFDKHDNLAISENFSLLTPTKQQSVLDLIIENFETTFGWVKKIGN